MTARPVWAELFSCRPHATRRSPARSGVVSIVWLLSKGNWDESLLISESGAFILLVYHVVPDNRALRRWLVQEVLPARDGYAAESLAERPVMADMHWNGGVLRTLQWHSELWVKMRDLPELVQIQHKRVRSSLWRRWMTGWLGSAKSKV